MEILVCVKRVPDSAENEIEVKEDAIKVAGLEGKMEAIDLCELIDRHLQRGT